MNPATDCWEWNGSLTWGYGYFQMDGVRWRVHRLIYLTMVGPIPEGLELDHLCRVRHCVNPAHLEPVTRKENTLRGIGPSMAHQRAVEQTHCKYGHEYTPENTYIQMTPRGYTNRTCRICRRERKRQRRAEKRASA